MSARERYAAMAARWDAAGRPADMLVAGYTLIAMRCWSCSAGAKVDGVGDRLEAFMRASEMAQPEDWLDPYLDEREWCRRCGESVRFESIMLCTHCSGTWCHRCAAQLGQQAANGNPACACGGELGRMIRSL